jgi:uncharacterized protein (UPF0297 family)
MRKLSDTQRFSDFADFDKGSPTSAGEILNEVYWALKEKGYNPVNQIVGYILSGDPTYITSYKNARVLVGRLERDELLEELVTFYLDENIL